MLIAGTQVTDDDAVKKLQRGKDIALVGVSIQIGAFGLFTVVAARFQFTSKRFKGELEKRAQRAPDGRKVLVEGCPRPIRANWVAMLFVINASCLLVLVSRGLRQVPAAKCPAANAFVKVRSVFREVDFAEGKTGNTQRYEYL